MTQEIIAVNKETELTKYDPGKGLKSITTFEAAEKHFARAKDTTQLETAIRAKLEAQAEFVFWWDTKGPGKEGRGNVSGRKHFAGADGLPDRLTVHRWRKKLNEPNKFEETFRDSLSRYAKILEFDTTAHVGQNAGQSEWYTPADYIEAARAVMGEIDLDPATTETANAVVGANQIFTLEEDGLKQEWKGCVWMNPPYAQPLISEFCKKLRDDVSVGSVSEAIVLVNNATETEWFQDLVQVSSVICFPAGRIKFWHPERESMPLQGQAVVYVGGNLEGFSEAFSGFGFLVRVTKWYRLAIKSSSSLSLVATITSASGTLWHLSVTRVSIGEPSMSISTFPANLVELMWAWTKMSRLCI